MNSQTPCVNNQESQIEALLAELGIKTEREPHLFGLRFAPDVKILEAVAPDFWLPEFSIHVELTFSSRAPGKTTFKKKNQQLKVLRREIPFARVRLLCKEDTNEMLALMQEGKTESAMELLFFDEDMPLALAYDFRDQARLDLPHRKMNPEVEALVSVWKEAKM